MSARYQGGVQVLPELQEAHQSSGRADDHLGDRYNSTHAESPYTAMLEKSQNIMAFPSTIGVIKSKGKGNSIEIPYPIHYAETIALEITRVNC